MTRPQYVRDISDAYAGMYNAPTREQVVEGKSKDHDYNIPEWQRLLNKHKQREDRKRPPHGVHVEPAASAEEEENIGVGSDFMTAFLDKKEAQNREVDDDAQEYLETIINEIPTSDIHKVVKDAFTAGARSRRK